MSIGVIEIRAGEPARGEKKKRVERELIPIASKTLEKELEEGVVEKVIEAEVPGGVVRVGGVEVRPRPVAIQGVQLQPVSASSISYTGVSVVSPGASQQRPQAPAGVKAPAGSSVSGGDRLYARYPGMPSYIFVGGAGRVEVYRTSSGGYMVLRFNSSGNVVSIDYYRGYSGRGYTLPSNICSADPNSDDCRCYMGDKNSCAAVLENVYRDEGLSVGSVVGAAEPESLCVDVGGGGCRSIPASLLKTRYGLTSLSTLTKSTLSDILTAIDDYWRKQQPDYQINVLCSAMASMGLDKNKCYVNRHQRLLSLERPVCMCYKPYEGCEYCYCPDTDRVEAVGVCYEKPPSNQVSPTPTQQQASQQTQVKQTQQQVSPTPTQPQQGVGGSAQAPQKPAQATQPQVAPRGSRGQICPSQGVEIECQPGYTLYISPSGICYCAPAQQPQQQSSPTPTQQQASSASSKTTSTPTSTSKPGEDIPLWMYRFT